MASFSGNDRPPKPPDIGTGGKPLTSSSIITQHQAITPTELEEIAAKKSLPEKFHSAGITTSGHTQTSDLHRSIDDGPCSVDPNQGHNFSQPSLQLHEFSPEHCPVATVAEQPTNNGDSSSVRRTHGLGPHGHSSSSSGAHNHTMGQDQFPPKLDEFMLEVQALFDKFGYKEFDVSLLLQMLNSLRGSSIDDGITVDHQPIASNDNQISGTNPSKVRFARLGSMFQLNLVLRFFLQIRTTLQ